MGIATERVAEGDLRAHAVLLLVAAVAALVALTYWQSYASMAGVWRSAEHAHGMLAFPAVGYLLWRVRARLARVRLEPCPWALVPMAVLVPVWFVAAAVGVQAVEHLAAVLLIPVTVLALLGWPLVRAALFPLAFVVAAVPVGDGLVPPLMELTADISTALLHAAAVPVFRQGRILSLPGGDFEIAEVCSGLQYLIAGTIIGSLLGYFVYRSMLRRVVLVAVMAVTMIVANGVRAFVVMYVASATEMRYLAHDHYVFGWVLFAVVVVVMASVAARFSDRGADERRHAAYEALPVPAPAASGPLALVMAPLLLAALVTTLGGSNAVAFLAWPAAGALAWVACRRLVPNGSDAAPYRRAGALAALSGAAVAIGGGPALLSNALAVAPRDAADIALPLIEGCDAPGGWSADWRPELHAPDLVASGTYWCAGEPMHVFFAAYLTNVQGHELVNDSNKLVPDAWRPLGAPHEFAAADGTSVRVNELVLTGSGSSSLVWYWYASGGRPATTGAGVKLRQALQLLTEGRADGSAYVVQTAMDGSVEAARRRLALAAREIGALGL